MPFTSLQLKLFPSNALKQPLPLKGLGVERRHNRVRPYFIGRYKAGKAEYVSRLKAFAKGFTKAVVAESGISTSSHDALEAL